MRLLGKEPDRNLGIAMMTVGVLGAGVMAVLLHLGWFATCCC
jgi:hypothetical protein